MESGYVKKLSSHRRWNTVLSPNILLVIGLGVLILFGNIVFSLLVGAKTDGQLLTSRQEHSTGVALVTSIDTHHVLVATTTDMVQVLEDGHPTASLQFQYPIGGLVADASAHLVYVGTSDGKISVFDDSLHALRSFFVDGRVVGMKPGAQGGILVAYGSGVYSGHYYVSSFPQGRPPTDFIRPVGSTIADIDVMDQHLFYVTTNAQVGSIDAASGKSLWMVTLPQPATRLLALAQGHQLLVGDTSGNIVLTDGQGSTQWETTVSAYPVRSLGFDSKTDTIFAGDTQGEIFILDHTGKLLTTQNATKSSVEAFLPASSGSFTLLPRAGQWLTLRPSAVQGLVFEDTLRPFWYGFNAIFLTLFLLALIRAVRRLRIAAQRFLVALKSARLAYLFILPAFALILLFSYYPGVLAVYYSFTNFSLQNITQFVGLQNYVKVLTQDFYFRVGLLNMVIIALASVVKTITLPLLAAELVLWVRNPTHRYIFRTLFVLPAVVPALVLTFMWRMVYDPNTGLLNQILSSVGLGQLQQAWLGNESTALGAIVGVGFPFITAFPFLIYLSGLINISPELYEAAGIDGANWWTRFWQIDVPLLLPQFRVLLFFALAGTLQGFVDIFVLTRGGPGTATYVPALQMYLSISDGNFGYASAIGVILFVLIFVLTLFVLRFRRQSTEETT